jgi:hypothetical protein
VQQSLLRLNKPAEALDEVAIAQATTAKATKIRRIRNSPKNRNVTLPTRLDSMAVNPAWAAYRAFECSVLTRTI